ncbi:hypothetical protein B0T13DRAFT_457351 [Neurospora crassa]|nr:hypothetical protein B0T13DRAFT_457351 [Neurospora crassa]
MHSMRLNENRSRLNGEAQQLDFNIRDDRSLSVSHTGEHVDVYAACSITSSGKSLPHIPRRPTQNPAEMPTMSSPDFNFPSPSSGPLATDLIMYIGIPPCDTGCLAARSRIKRMLRYNRLTELTRSDMINLV